METIPSFTGVCVNGDSPITREGFSHLIAFNLGSDMGSIPELELELIIY